MNNAFQLNVDQNGVAKLVFDLPGEKVNKFTVPVMEELEMPPIDAGHSWHLFIVRLRAGLLTKNRNQFIDELKEAGIGTSVHFIPLHLHSYYRQQYGHSKGDFPNAEDAYERAISLPIYPGMSQTDVEYVVNTIKRIVQANRARVYVSSMRP